MTETNYYFATYSPYTYPLFLKSKMDRTGIQKRYSGIAKSVKVGDVMIIYMTGVSRFCGILEVQSEAFISDDRIYFENDPYNLQFKVKPVVLLDIEHSLPISTIWNELSITKGRSKNSGWGALFQRSLGRSQEDDALFLVKKLIEQNEIKKVFPLSKNDNIAIASWIRLGDRIREESFEVKTDSDESIIVTIPTTNGDEVKEETDEIKESIKIQSVVAKIGEIMGYKVWIPANNRQLVKKVGNINDSTLLKVLPLNYDDATIKTIEQIDAIFFSKKTIVRVFEVEHTTSIYSGILRMSDLLSLQTNMHINIHIVAPEDRREKVFAEIQRPTFSLLESGALSDKCSFISYDNINEILSLKHLSNMNHNIIDEYSEYVR